VPGKPVDGSDKRLYRRAGPAGAVPISSDNQNSISVVPPPDGPVRRPTRTLLPDTGEFVPHMLAELEDELARSRMREAFWISVIIHILMVLLIIFSPDLLPKWAQPHILRAEDLAKNKNLTFLELPPDVQKVPKVKSDKLSDKDRQSQMRHAIDEKTLEELRRGDQRPPSPQPSQQEAPPSSAMAQQQGNGMRQQYAQPTQRMEPEEQPDPNAFRMPGSAGDQIEQAARGAGHFRTGGGGTGYGIGPVDRNARMGNLDILSDTQGVDFGPYLSRALQSIKNNWYNLIPEEARAPLMKHGKVTIRFLIMANGKVAGLYVEAPSGDIPLDRAAYGGITGSDPFSPLPHEFHGPYLALRIRFYYNPATGEMESDPN